MEGGVDTLGEGATNGVCVTNGENMECSEKVRSYARALFFRKNGCGSARPSRVFFWGGDSRKSGWLCHPRVDGRDSAVLLIP